MADKTQPTFTTLDACNASLAEIKASDPDTKKKVYVVTLPSVETYANFLKTTGSSTLYSAQDGYAAHAYNVFRLMGGTVSTAGEKTSATAKLAAATAEATAAKEAAAKAEAEAESTKQLLADMQRQMEELRASLAATAANNGTQPETAGTKGRKARPE